MKERSRMNTYERLTRILPFKQTLILIFFSFYLNSIRNTYENQRINLLSNLFRYTIFILLWPGVSEYVHCMIHAGRKRRPNVPGSWVGDPLLFLSFVLSSLFYFFLLRHTPINYLDFLRSFLFLSSWHGCALTPR